jgi:pilus retraction protein PilT
MSDPEIPQFYEELKRNGAVNFSCSSELLGEEIPKTRLRIHTFLDSEGISIVGRILKNEIPDFEGLGFDPDSIQRIQSQIRKPTGMILVTGPTGSGKTTTLGSIVQYINLTTPKHIVTVEDPIEIHYGQYSPLIEGSDIYRSLITQREVGVHTDSFRNGLHDALRQDPNIILLGELRSMETIESALNASETGHLVFSTLHTNGGYKTINRIVSEFPADRRNFICSQLAANLNCIISQRLLPRIDRTGRILAYEYLEISGPVKAALLSGDPERIPNSMDSKNSIRWNDNLRALRQEKIISEEVMQMNWMEEQG